jgi:hypothetical protein
MTNGDVASADSSVPLIQMKYSPVWFKSLAWLETVLQLPFFIIGMSTHGHLAGGCFGLLCEKVDLKAMFVAFAGAYAYAAGKAWIKVPATIYGISTATTVIPCLAEIAFAKLPLNNRLVLMAIYTPYLLIPAAIAARMLLSEEAFPQRQRHFPKKRK